jgi:type I restriction enzyme S subunit
LTELAQLETGHTPSRKKPEFWDGDIPWIGIRDATSNHGRRIDDTMQHTNKLGIENSSARVLPPDTVCLSRTASIGYVVVMGREMATSQDFVNWVCSGELDWRYLKYVLLAEYDSIKRFAHGTTHQTVYFPEVKAFHILAPPIDEQRRIVRVLGALDGKIENNRKVAKTLEEIAATLFKARFVDFLDHQDLVDSEIGPIPREWSATPVGDLAKYVNGKAFTKFGNGKGRMVIRIADLRSGPGNSTVYTDFEADADFLARRGDMLFAWSGSLDVYRWHRDEALINQHIFKVIPLAYPAWFVFQALKYVMPYFQAIAADKATTMGHIKRSHLADFALAVPPADELARQNVVFGPLFEQALQVRMEAEALSHIRDALLPKLISGQIRVSKAMSTGAPST